MFTENGITIADLMESDSMRTSKLVAGEAGTLRTISRINIMADPDILHWVEKDEFLLTTGFFFQDEEKLSQKDFIDECISLGLSGLGIKLQPFLDTLGEDAIRTANQANFPIIDIDETVPLSRINLMAMQAILDRKTRLLELLEVVHSRFSNILVEGGGIEEILSIVAETIRNPIALHLSHTNSRFFIGEHLNQFHAQSLLANSEAFYTHRSDSFTEKSMQERKIFLEGKLLTRLTIPVYLKNNIVGHMFSWSTHTPLGGFDYAIMESAVTMISLVLLQDLSVQEIEINYRSVFFDNLISDDPHIRSQALNKASLYRMEADDHFAAVVLKLQCTDESEEITDQVFHDRLISCVRIIDSLKESYSLSGITTTGKQSVQILLNDDDCKILSDALLPFCRNLQKDITRKAPYFQVQVGVGKIVQGIDEVRTTFYSAKTALKLVHRISEEPVISYGDLHIYKLLANARLMPELQDLFDETLLPLTIHDEKKNGELIETLESFFVNDSNISKVSKDLFIHYNTALYRLQKIEKLTGLSLSNPEDRLMLNVALKARKILET